MSISGINATDPIAASSSALGAQQSLGKDSFMKLLVNQLKNQDPLSPTDNQAFIAQLAQFSSLEQMQTLNENILGLAVLQQSNALMAQLTQSSALIGKDVRYMDPDTNNEATGSVSSVKIKDGVAVLNIGSKDVPLGNVTEVLGDHAAPASSGSAGSTGRDSSTTTRNDTHS